jgi:hypothetical protein
MLSKMKFTEPVAWAALPGFMAQLRAEAAQ